MLAKFAYFHTEKKNNYVDWRRHSAIDTDTVSIQAHSIRYYLRLWTQENVISSKVGELDAMANGIVDIVILLSNL